jgi:hypothetical protein
MDLPRTIDMQYEAVMTDLSSREPLFHRPEHGSSRADFERMTVEEFWEIGASGRRYTREFILDELEKRFAAPHEDIWEIRDFRCQRLAQELYLVTYTLIQDGMRLTRRSTIWRRTGEDWKAVFHQGTLVPESD